MKDFLNKFNKDRLFWYILTPLLVEITLLISLSPFIFEGLATPVDRIFAGINRWSTDYFLYLSYIEQGARGFLSTKLIFTTQSHPSVFFYLGYAIPGYIFGHLLGINSVFIYHSFRALYGLIFLSMTILFFYKISRSKIITLTAFILTFYVSGFVKIISLIPFEGMRYLEWLQEQNIIGRPTGPLHYSLGFIVFIGAFLFYFYSKAKPLKKTIIFGLFLNGLLLTNPFNFLLIAIAFIIYLPIKFLILRNWKESFLEFKILFGSALVSLPLFLLLNYYLSMPPWGIVGVSPKFYVKTTPPVSLWKVSLSVGPIFFLGILGAIKLFSNQITSNGVIPVKTGIQTKITLQKDDDKQRLSILIFLIIWPFIQFFLLLNGDRFKIHPPRVFSGLYFLPLAYFSATLINSIFKKSKIILTIVFLAFIITIPNYFLSYKEQLFAFTDFRNFSQFVYPTKKQVEAFKFLEKNTPAYSGVLAMYEASSLINGFSGNMTEVGLDQTLKEPFFGNKLSDQEAIKFLNQYHFNYVYYGYQEQIVGGDMKKYKFLKKIFENPEASIYELKL